MTCLTGLKQSRPEKMISRMLFLCCAAASCSGIQPLLSDMYSAALCCTSNRRASSFPVAKNEDMEMKRSEQC